jgi:hypothetical protein
MIRVFLASSHLSAVFQALYAKKTKETHFIDVLMIDSTFKKESLVRSIFETQEIYNWNYVLDFSTRLADNQSIRTGIRKRFLRRVKHLPLLKNIYVKLLNKHEEKHAEFLKQKIIEQFNEKNINNLNHVKLFMLTQTILNRGLIAAFPNASINYMEHGTGDYFYVSKLKTDFENYFCAFDIGFKNYLSKRNSTIEQKVKPYLDKKDFEISFKTIAHQSAEITTLDITKKYVLILLDAFECYEPEKRFWSDFIDRCLQEVQQKSEYVFLFKPHPNQSNESIEISLNHIKTLNINFRVLNSKGTASFAVESLFVSLPKAIHYVFTTFSSALFYIAKYYPEDANYYILYDFVKPYTHNSPKQYVEIFDGLNEMITEVFDEGRIIRIM